MIVVQYHYICFWLEPGEFSESADKATDFLFKSVFPAMEESALLNVESGGIAKGFDPEKLDEEIVSHRWLKKCLKDIKERYPGFDDNAEDIDEKKKSSHRQEAFESVILWKFPKNEPPKFTLEIRIGWDLVTFRWFYTKEVHQNEFKVAIDNDIEDFKLNFSGELLYATFFHLVGKPFELKELELLNESFTIQEFEDYTVKWQIDQEASNDNNNHYRGRFLCHYKPGLELDSTEMKNFEKQWYESREFLDILYLMLINVKKIEYEYEIANSKFKLIKSKFESIESSILEITKRQEDIFAPSLLHSELTEIRRKNFTINQCMLEFNNLVNTCNINKNSFENRKERYLTNDGHWFRDSSNRIASFIDNLQINRMRLSNLAQIIQDEIKFLLDIGTREVSLHYANELLIFNDINRGPDGVKNKNFLPLIISTNKYNPGASEFRSGWSISIEKKKKGFELFEVYRPSKIREEKFENLKKYYVEAFYQLTESKLEMLLDGILNQEGEIYLLNKASPTESLRIKTDLLFKKNKSLDSRIFKEIGCEIEAKYGPCQIKPVSSEFDQNNDFWISLMSLISFVDAILYLVENPKHHENVIRNEKYSSIKRKFLFLSGLFCIKSGDSLKAKEKLLKAVKIALGEQEFDWAFTVSQIAGLCERCEQSHYNLINSSAAEGKDLFFKKHTHEFLEAYDLPRAVSIMRMARRKEITYLCPPRWHLRWWLLTMSIVVMSSLIGSSFLLFVNNGSTSFATSSMVFASWIFALLGAPLALLIGAHGSFRNLFPELLYPKILAPLAIAVVTLSFSGEVIIPLFKHNKLLVQILIGIICLLMSVFSLQYIFKKIIKNIRERWRRVMDIINLSFLEASTLSALCMLIYEPTFSKMEAKFRTAELFNIEAFISPLYILLTSLFAVFFEVVIKRFFTPKESDFFIE